MKMPVGVAVISRPLGLFCWRPQFQAQTRNISATGFALLTERPLAVGAAIKLWVPVPNGAILKLRGTVVRSSPDEATGAVLNHIQLSKRPEQAMRIWTDTVFEDIRHFGD